MKKIFIAMSILSFLLNGCSDEASEVVQTEAYYMENEDARNLKIKDCKENPDKASTSCRNAYLAKAKIQMKQMMGES